MQFKKLLVGLLLFSLLGLEVLIKAGNVSPFLFQILFNKNVELKHANPDSINLLLLGRGGGKHDGPNLTDTMILANVDLKTSQVTLVSIPRDIWVSELSGRNKKINEAFSQGESKRKGAGLLVSKSVIGKVTGQNVDYAAVIDFAGFVKAVDLMGGIDIEVENTLDDYAYPIEGREDDLCGHSAEEVKDFISSNSASLTAEADQEEYFSCRYEHLHFSKGKTHMNGITALKFVRSRHAKGEEGTDFARSKRQEKVIKAILQKAVSLQILTNPAKVIGLYSTLQSSVQTDIAQNEIDDFVKLAQKIGTSKINSIVIDYGDPATKRAGLLMNPPISQKYNYEWVLIPRLGDGNYTEIHNYIRCELAEGNCKITPTP
jgi:LCP family protein required for cell wall assembly